MEREISIQDKKISRLYAFIGLLLICFYMLTELVFELWYRVSANYGLFLIIAFISISFFLRFFNSSKEEKCLVLYALWVLVSRALNGDVYLNREFYFLVRTVLNTGCFICIGFVLDNEDRRRFFDLVCAIVCAYWFVLASIGIYATLNLCRIALPPAGMTVGFARVGANYQLTVDNIHRNVSAVWFALAAVLMVYQFFNCKKRFWRVPITLAGLVFYVATVLSFSRAALLGMCVALTMLVLLLVLRCFEAKSNRLKALLCVLVILVGLPLFYKSSSVATKLCSAVSSAVVAGEEFISEETAQEVGEKEVVFEEGRDSENMAQLGGRSFLWKAGFMVLGEEPERLIKGGLIGPYMERVAELADEIAGPDSPGANAQMHNFILDSLMLTGLPGALILIVFTLFLVIRMVRVFFSATAPMQLKLLTLPVAMLLVDNMMEAHILRYDIMPSILFFFITGTFLAWSYEALPGKEKQCADI